jgi:uncharacterized membrane protein YqgA involved in biofilm formation
MLSLWAKTSGTWINLLTIVLGTVLGLTLRKRLSPATETLITQALGLVTMTLGVTMAQSLSRAKAGPVDGIILALLALVVGGAMGEWWQLEGRLTALGDALKARLKGGGQFTQGFVSASLLFCIGPMAILGSLSNGLAGDSTLLTLKATMDGLASIALTSSYGVGVGFSALSVLVVQGSLSLLASVSGWVVADPATNPYILIITGVGGLMILALGLTLLEVVQIRLASFLPALGLAPLAIALIHRLQP